MACRVMEWIRANNWVCTGIGSAPRQVRVCHREEYPLLQRGGEELVSRSAAGNPVEKCVTIPDDITDAEFDEFVNPD